MTTSDAKEKKPLWLSIEEKILALGSQDLSGPNFESAIQRIAGELDQTGTNVSRHGGHMLQLRWALNRAAKAGRPLMKDFNAALEALTLEAVADPYSATSNLIDEIGKSWPELKKAERRKDVIGFVEKKKLDLLIARAKGLPGDEGIRLLIEQQVDPEQIVGALKITEDKLKQVNAEIEKERAERGRVTTLLGAVEGKSDEEKVRHLFTNNVPEKLIVEIGKIGQGVIDGVKAAMEAELKEKQRLEAEAAERRKAEAEGPALENIPPDEMLAHIEAIREIMEFSDVEKEIRVMCEQSSIPKALVDMAVSEPDKLDELEKKAQG